MSTPVDDEPDDDSGAPRTVAVPVDEPQRQAEATVRSISRLEESNDPADDDAQ